MKNKIWRQLQLPLIGLVAIATLLLIWRLLDLPSGEALTDVVSHYFDIYGYWVIFLSAIVEGLLLAGLYYPGSVVIFLGVILANGDVKQVIIVVVVTTLGLIIAHIINYLLGKYGWYRLLVKLGLSESIENAKGRLTRYGIRAIFLSHWHPNFGAFISTAAGILNFSPRTFLLSTIVAISIWDIFWGTMAYVVGEAAMSVIGPAFAFFVIGVWMVISLIKAINEHRKKAPR